MRESPMRKVCWLGAGHAGFITVSGIVSIQNAQIRAPTDTEGQAVAECLQTKIAPAHKQLEPQY